jgi:heterodisulfide reductase subunit C
LGNPEDRPLKEIPEELRELIKKKALFCYQCGACVGSCPTSRAVPEYNPRRIIEKLVMGGWRDVISGSSIWLCTLCHTCHEVCPQGVGISDMIIELRNMATKDGIAPMEFVRSARQMASTGWTTTASSAVLRRREQLGLPNREITGIAEMKKAIELTGLADILENDEE